ncbi:MAG: 16S rRNA (uracil(1498)-N(3))-methyltransferase [Candidatus Hydrogenedentes bacterium]|nr:16S rRNA (uracil(1498)-N(3))-methyltransferase [Candidatus Hydrogenedentota bacterium]
MAHAFRFYIAPDSPIADEVALPPDEAHHALHVARVQVGDAVTLFDGQGREWDGRVANATRRDAVIAIGPVREVPRPRWRLTLAQAWIKRDKAIESIIQRGTELGVGRFSFFPATHSERKPHGEEKWLKYAIESCKQCGRAWLPAFDVAESLEGALQNSRGAVILATKDEAPTALRDAVTGSEVTLLVGPEGDFTAEERAAALRHGAKAVSFGSVTYRSEAAAILGATLILRELGEFGA